MTPVKATGYFYMKPVNKEFIEKLAARHKRKVSPTVDEMFDHLRTKGVVTLKSFIHRKLKKAAVRANGARKRSKVTKLTSRKKHVARTTKKKAA